MYSPSQKSTAMTEQPDDQVVVRPANLWLYCTSSQLLSLDHLFRFTIGAACLLAIGTRFDLYAYRCMSAAALFPGISFGTPRR